MTVEQLRSQPAFVLEADSVVGFYSLRVVDGTCELDNLWVVPSEAGRGHGRELLAHAVNVARSMGLREIVIDADPNAENFYMHCGATVTGAVPAPIEGQPGGRGRSCDSLLNRARNRTGARVVSRPQAVSRGWCLIDLKADEYGISRAKLPFPSR